MTFIAEESPFVIPHENVEVLCNDEGFQILRRYLARDVEYVPHLRIPATLFHIITQLQLHSTDPTTTVSAPTTPLPLHRPRKHGFSTATSCTPLSCPSTNSSRALRC